MREEAREGGLRVRSQKVEGQLLMWYSGVYIFLGDRKPLNGIKQGCDRVY